MRPLRYWFVQALRGIRSGLLIQLASTGAIAVGLLLVGLVALGAVNLERLTESWSEGVQVTVYLQPEAKRARVASLQRVLGRHPSVRKVEHVSSAQAYTRLADSLGHRKGLLEGVERDFLPASLEVTLASATRDDQLRPLIALLKTSPAVEEVDYQGHWLERVSSLVALLRSGAVALAFIVCLACLYIIASTIRLGVFARRDEIEILKLVGATDRFVRAPFLIEGALQGLLGAVVACLGLYLIYWASAPRLEQLLAAALTQVQISFLSAPHLALGIIGGALLGVIGSRLALGRYMDV
jgi:cell division transport system permease protein